MKINVPRGTFFYKIKTQSIMKNLIQVYEQLKDELAENEQVACFYFFYGDEEGEVDSENDATVINLVVEFFRAWGQKDEKRIDDVLYKIGKSISGENSPCVFPTSEGDGDGVKIYGWTQDIDTLKIN